MQTVNGWTHDLGAFNSVMLTISENISTFYFSDYVNIYYYYLIVRLKKSFFGRIRADFVQVRDNLQTVKFQNFCGILPSNKSNGLWNLGFITYSIIHAS